MLIPVLFLSLGGPPQAPPAKSVHVLVRGDFPEGRPAVVRAELLGPEDAVLTVTEVPANGKASLTAVPPDAIEVRFSSPVHEECVASLDLGLEEIACELSPLPVIRPFGKGDGRVWVRRVSPPSSFVSIPELEREWGGGFAVPRGTLDVVLAPRGSAASMYRLAEASTLQPGREGGREKPGPGRLVARFIGPDGMELRSRPRLTVETFIRPRREQQLELDSWNAFYEKNGVENSGPSVVIEPLPDESVSFTVEFPGHPGVRIGSRGRALDGTVDLGVVRVPRPTAVGVSLRTELSPGQLPAALSFELRLVHPVPGIRPPAKSPSLRRDAVVGGRTRFEGLLPGEWLLSVRAADEVVGELPLHLAEGPDNAAEVLLTREVVMGRFLDDEGKGIGSAIVGLSRSRYSTKGRRNERTDDEGSFRLEFLHAGGEVAVWALPGEDCALSAESLDPRGPGAMDVVLRTRGKSSRILVSDASTAKPIGNADVEIDFSIEGGVNGSFRRKTSSSDGTLRLCNFGAGKFTFSARAEGYEERTVETTRDPLRPEDVRIALRPAARVRGRVYGASGAPAVLASVFGPLSAGLPDEEEPRSVRTDQSGAFVLDVPPDEGPVFVAVAAPGHRLALRWLRPGPEENAVILMSAGADDVVTTLFSDGVPIRGAYFALVAGGIRVPTALLAAATAAGGCSFEPASRDGRSLFGGCVEPGTYDLFARVFRSGGAGYLPLGSYQFPLPPGIELRSPLQDVP